MTLYLKPFGLVLGDAILDIQDGQIGIVISYNPENDELQVERTMNNSDNSGHGIYLWTNFKADYDAGQIVHLVKETRMIDKEVYVME